MAKRKKASGGKKGNPFERSVCTVLSMWWTGRKRDDVFWRTGGSGARATVRASRGKKTANQCGDICATDTAGQPLVGLITFELKRGYNTATMHDLLDRSDAAKKLPTYVQWCMKVGASAATAGTPFWAVIHRRDGRQALITIPFQLHLKLVNGPDQPNCLIWSSGSLGGEVVSMRLEDFITYVTPVKVISLYETWRHQCQRST